MATAKGPSKKAKFSKEVEEIKRLRDLNRILTAGDLENALLSNSAKDSETVNDNVLDVLLSKANSVETRGNDRGLEAIEKLTTSTAGGSRIIKQKSVKINRSKGKIKVKRSIHIKKSKPKPAKKSKSRKR
jgi:hypothetical protein